MGMTNYKTKRIKEIKDFGDYSKREGGNVPIIKIISNIDRVHDFLLNAALIPPKWVDDKGLIEFEIIPITPQRAFVKRGYKAIQFHVASWETLQPSVTFYLDRIPEPEHHIVESVAMLSTFKMLNTRLPNVIMVEFTIPL